MPNTRRPSIMTTRDEAPDLTLLAMAALAAIRRSMEKEDAQGEPDQHRDRRKYRAAARNLRGQP
ncbi:hypothetical protein HMPREF1986_02246 [Oribacterium sp. oral taxon 078 str. F0263]|nr:hypothetical protein HMPREF1986_02246 [Oribacterium sp. oral taxon 078 str. F0263]